jgi:hypothetical protein
MITKQIRPAPWPPWRTVSDSGSGLGAAIGRQLRPDAAKRRDRAVPSATDVLERHQAAALLDCVLSSGRRGRRFKSGHPDQIIACQRSGLRSCWIARIRIVRFWERRCPILGADLKAGSTRTPKNGSRVSRAELITESDVEPQRPRGQIADYLSGG